MMRKVTVQVFSKDAVWTVKADEGVLDNETRDVTVTGNVVVSSNDGLTIETPELTWRNKERHLFTEHPVEIKRTGTTITGRGLDVRMQEHQAVIPKKRAGRHREPRQGQSAPVPRDRVGRIDQ